MKKAITIIVVIVIVFIIFLLLGPFYVVTEGEQAVVVRFGRIISTSSEAGLKIKAPLVDNVVRYSKKILSWDGEPQRIPTQENQFIWVDVTARWKITDLTTFYESVNTMDQGYARLDDVIDSSVRTIISRNQLREAVRNSNIINEIDRAVTFEQGDDTVDYDTLTAFTRTDIEYDPLEKGRSKLSDEMYVLASAIAPQYGITLIDMIVRQIRYSDDLTESVYNRMIKERNQIAQAFRSYGEGAKAEWMGKLDNEKRTILSQAYETAELTKGTADATATAIYAESYQQDADFFQFWRSIESYKTTLPVFSKTLSTDMDYFRFMYNMQGR